MPYFDPHDDNDRACDDEVQTGNEDEEVLENSNCRECGGFVEGVGGNGSIEEGEESQIKKEHSV